jgi:hypothetical protein
MGDRIITVLDTLARTEPSVYATRLGTHPTGDLGTIVGGPVEADDLIWWQIDYDTSPDGWSGGEERFDKHVPVSAKFNIGDRIVTVMDTLARRNPSVYARRLGTHPTGDQGTIVGGPVAADGLIWWQIDYDKSPDGWSGDEERFDKHSAFEAKCAEDGVLGCFNFDSTTSLNYTWPAGTSCDANFAGQTNAANGQANASAVVQNGQCVYPEIDAANAHSGAGSLKFKIPSNSSANTGGSFSEPLKRNSDGTLSYIGPGSPLGNVLYFQFYQKFDSNSLTADFQCLGGECSGLGQAFFFGNPPEGGSAGSLYVGISDAQRRILQMSSDRAAGNRTDQWIEFTGRIEVREASNAPSSRVQVWINGQLAIDDDSAKIDWAGTDANGVVQFLLSAYLANKDPNRAHADGYTWFDDVIISTQPIPMISSRNGGSTTMK